MPAFIRMRSDTRQLGHTPLPHQLPRHYDLQERHIERHNDYQYCRSKPHFTR
jgi:hypothetical protein